MLISGHVRVFGALLGAWRDGERECLSYIFQLTKNTKRKQFDALVCLQILLFIRVFTRVAASLVVFFVRVQQAPTSFVVVCSISFGPSWRLALVATHTNAARGHLNPPVERYAHILHRRMFWRLK